MDISEIGAMWFCFLFGLFIYHICTYLLRQNDTGEYLLYDDSDTDSDNEQLPSYGDIYSSEPSDPTSILSQSLPFLAEEPLEVRVNTSSNTSASP